MPAHENFRHETTFFADRATFRAWLEKHYASASALIVGFYKKKAQRPGLTYAEAVDEALCFGWIDGLIRRIDNALGHDGQLL